MEAVAKFRNPMRVAVPIYSDKDVQLGHWRDTFFTVWRGTTTTAAVQRMARAIEGFAAAKPWGIGLLTVVQENAPMAEREPMRLLADWMSKASYVKGSALIFEGTGWRAGAVRSAVALITMFAPPSFAHKVFGSSVQAATWLLPHLPPVMRGNAEEMTDALASLRER